MLPAPAAAPSFILHERARQHAWSGAGLLSIKSFYHGRALYRLGEGFAAVDESSYLILNAGQPYTIAIDSDAPVESFCVFFAPGLAEAVSHSLRAGDAALLDQPDAASAPVNFFDRTYPHDDRLSPALRALRVAWPQRQAEAGWLEEQLHGLMARLLWQHQALAPQVAGMPAARPATRAELYRRLHRARDHASACFTQPLTLDDLARVACLSPNHLLRSFRRAFGQSPHQYLTRLRLERAAQLLAAGALPVTEVCLAVGFASLGSFSSLFRRRYGVAPSAYRRGTG